MGTRRCCCNPNCVICSDEFTRANSDPPSGNWNVVSGEWEISVNRLLNVSTGPILTTCRQQHSKRANTNYSIKVFFKCINIKTASVYGVIVGYVDSSNFYWVQLDESGGSLYPTFYHRIGGSDTLLMDIGTHPGGVGFPYSTEDGSWEGKICFSKVDWTVDAAAGGSYETPPNTGEEGIEIQGSETQWTYTSTTAVIGSLPSSPNGMVGFLMGDFDNWAFHYHWESIITCDYCSCFCRNPNDVDDYAQLPECLLATFVPLFDPTTYACELNTAYIELAQGTVGGGLSPRKFVWSSYTTGFNTPTDLEAFFYCLSSSASDPNDRFRLCLKIPSLSGTYTFGTGLTEFTVPCGNAANITCNPILSMDFGELYAGYTTCEISPGVQGIKNPLCITGNCLVENQINIDFLNSLRWKVVITKCA